MPGTSIFRLTTQALDRVDGLYFRKANADLAHIREPRPAKAIPTTFLGNHTVGNAMSNPNYLAEADKLITAAKESLTQQEHLIKMLEASGHATAAAKTVLAHLEKSLETLERQRKLVAELKMKWLDESSFRRLLRANTRFAT
jgi:hypothetical protein